MTETPDLRSRLQPTGLCSAHMPGIAGTDYTCSTCFPARVFLAEIDRLRAEVERVTRERDEWRGRAADRNSEAEKYARRAWDAEARAAKLAEALGPFADAANMADERMMLRYLSTDLPDDTTVHIALNLTLGHLRAARTALAGVEGRG